MSTIMLYSIIESKYFQMNENNAKDFFLFVVAVCWSFGIQWWLRRKNTLDKCEKHEFIENGHSIQFSPNDFEKPLSTYSFHNNNNNNNNLLRSQQMQARKTRHNQNQFKACVNLFLITAK